MKKHIFRFHSAFVLMFVPCTRLLVSLGTLPLKQDYFLTPLLAVLLVTNSCKKSVTPTPTPATQVDTTTLRSVASFPVGSAMNPDLIKDNTYYYKIASTQYSSLTPENVMKFAATEPSLNQFSYADGDYLVFFAAQHHMRVHAHNLIWYTALPDWVINFQGDSLAWESMFKTHIETVADHFKGEVASWDVVNEAIRDDDGTLRNQDISTGDGSIWRKHLGPDYVARAFQYAHEADPNALLFYNDYGQEYNGVKLDSIIALVTKLKTRGIPISGVGIQLHIDINTNIIGITIALQKLAATGLLIHISELDISVNPGNNQNLVLTDALMQTQAAKYQFVAETYRASVPPAQQYGITTWEFSDAVSWIPVYYKRPDWPLPFDASYNKKAAFGGFLKGLRQ
jgi:endo-1,4-beta-xylanase